MGLSMVKPCASIRSTKSIVAPVRYGTLIRSTTTSTPPKSRDLVAVEVTLVEEELVAQARAAARLHRDAQAQVVAALLIEQGLGLLRGGVGEGDAGGHRRRSRQRVVRRRGRRASSVDWVDAVSVVCGLVTMLLPCPGR